MGYTITNYSPTAVVTGIATNSSSYGSFLAPSSGQFPLFSGDTASGDITALSDLKGSPNATVLVFLQQGDAEISIQGDEFAVSKKSSSGIVSILIPEVPDPAQAISINVIEYVP